MYKTNVVSYPLYMKSSRQITSIRCFSFLYHSYSRDIVQEFYLFYIAQKSSIRETFDPIAAASKYLVDLQWLQTELDNIAEL